MITTESNIMTETIALNWCDTVTLCKKEKDDGHAPWGLLTIHQLEGGDESARRANFIQLYHDQILKLRDLLNRHFPPQLGGEQTATQETNNQN